MERSLKKIKAYPAVSLPEKGMVISSKKELATFRDAYVEVVNKQHGNVYEKIKHATTKELRDKLKKQLPCVCWQGYCEDSRKEENAQSTGLFMLDIDAATPDVGAKKVVGNENFDPDAMWSKVEPRIEELGIVAAYKSCSSRGMQLVAKCRFNTIEENQKWLADNLGVIADEKCKDLVRSSFLVPDSYFYYFDENGVFTNDSSSVYPSNGKAITPTPSSSVATSGGGETKGTSSTAAYYNGVHITDVIDRYITLKGGEFPVGERNAQELRLLCSLVHFFGEEVIKQYLPTYGLPPQEINAIIKSAQKYKKEGKPAADFMKILSDLETEIVLNSIPFDEKEFWEKTILPIGIKESIEYFADEHSRMAVLFSVITICGFYGTDLSYSYLLRGKKKNPIIGKLNFSTLVIGESGSGKGVIKDVYEAWMKEYNSMLDAGTSPNRELGTNVTTSGLMKALKEADGKHLINLTTEADQFLKNCNIGGYNDMWSSVKNACHNETNSSSYSIAESGKMAVKWNMLWSGTPSILDNLFHKDKNGRISTDNLENGLFSRFFIIPLEKTRKPISDDCVDYDIYEVNEEEHNTDLSISKAVKQIMKFDENFTLEINTYRPLLKSIKNWINDTEEKAEKMGNAAILNLTRRTAELAYRCGIIFHVLENEGNENLEEISQNAIDVAIAIATWQLRLKIKLFGNVYNEVLKSNPLHNCDVLNDDNAKKTKKNFWEEVRERIGANSVEYSELYKTYNKVSGSVKDKTTFDRRLREAKQNNIVEEIDKDGVKKYRFIKTKKMFFTYSKIRNKFRNIA